MELDPKDLDVAGWEPAAVVEESWGIIVEKKVGIVEFTKKKFGNVKAEVEVAEKECEVDPLLNVPEFSADVDTGVFVDTGTTCDDVVPSLVTTWVEDSEVCSMVELADVVGETAWVVAEVVSEVVADALVDTTAVVETEVEVWATETEVEESEVETDTGVTTVLEATLDVVAEASVVVAFDPACLLANSIIAFAFAASTKACATPGSCL